MAVYMFLYWLQCRRGCWQWRSNEHRGIPRFAAENRGRHRDVE